MVTENVTPDNVPPAPKTSRKDLSAFFFKVRDLVQRRNKYTKKSYNNELYKLIANSGIGQMGRGLNEKYSLDVHLNSNPITGGKLTNPLYAGWVTAFIRTTVSELLN